MKILELFGGIGACSAALKKLGYDIDVEYVDIDRFATESFNAIHGTNFQPTDIREWDKDIKVDLVMHGSPCQDFSVAGQNRGGDEGSGTRSSLMYETLRIVEKLRPKYVIWENVKNLLSPKHRHNFDAYQVRMAELGYNNHYQVMNARDYGIPQNRERVFTVSVRNDLPDDFIFPEKKPLKVHLSDLLESDVDEKYYLSEKALACFMSEGTGSYPRCERFFSNIFRKNQEIGNSITTNTGSRPTDNFVVASRGRDPKNPSRRTAGGTFIQRLEPRLDGVANTLTTVQKDNLIAELRNCRIRKLTPKECWRLMGFSDDDFDKAAQVCSNTQLYRQAGNSIVVNVLEAILKNLLS